MNENRSTHRILQSIGAVLTGLIAIVVITTLTDTVFHSTGIFPPFGEPMADSLFLLALAYRIIYGMAGGYIAACLAPDRPAVNGVALGIVGTLISVIGAILTWEAGAQYGPKWYPLALIATSIPAAWVGGKLRVGQLPRRATV